MQRKLRLYAFRHGDTLVLQLYLSPYLYPTLTPLSGHEHDAAPYQAQLCQAHGGGRLTETGAATMNRSTNGLC